MCLTGVFDDDEMKKIEEAFGDHSNILQSSDPVIALPWKK